MKKKLLFLSCTLLSITVLFAQERVNLVQNGDFSNGTSGWQFTSYPDPQNCPEMNTQATGSVVNGEFVANISNQGCHEYSVQLFRQDLSLQNGSWYLLTFDAYADESRLILPAVGQHNEPYACYACFEAMEINATKTTYSLRFKMNQPSDNNSRVGFDLGKHSAANVYIDNISLYEISAITTDGNGNEYATIEIGNQTWFAENLRTTLYNDDSPIQYIESAEDWANTQVGAYSYFENNSEHAHSYGALYNWYAVQTNALCPEGWRVPTLDDWNILFDFVGGEEIAGEKLKATYMWTNTEYGTDEFGFSALPTASRNSLGNFTQDGGFGGFWTATESTSIGYANHVGMYSDYSEVYTIGHVVNYGLSVRCVTGGQSTSLTVQTNAIHSVSYNSALVRAEVSPGVSFTSQGICWSKLPNPTVADYTNSSGDMESVFSRQLTNLEPNTVYYVRAYVEQSDTIIYGDEISFTTMEVPVYFERTNMVIGAQYGMYSEMNVSIQGEWQVSTDADWVYVSPDVPFSGPGIITVQALSDNTGGERIAYLHITGAGFNRRTIPVIQRDTILITNHVQNIVIHRDSVAPEFLFAEFFEIYTSSQISYVIESDNPKIADAVVLRDRFSFIPYSQGVARITLRARSQSGHYEEIAFNVTVQEDDSPSQCGILVLETITHVSCFGKSDGAIQIQVSGGEEPYVYRWSNMRTSKDIKELNAGQYSLLIKDNAGCIVAYDFEIQQPQELTVTELVSNPSCGISDGEITISIDGGITPYAVLWNTESNSENVDNLAAGIYTVTVTDNNSCKLEKEIVLQNIDAPTISIDSVQKTACNALDGAVFLRAYGGALPYTIVWNDIPDLRILQRTGLSPGNYYVSVIDADGCKNAVSIEIPEKSIIHPSIELVTVSQETGNNLIVWYKEQTDLVDYYTIYRETDSPYLYEVVGTLDYSLLSVKEDLTAIPEEQSWRYRITATDVCGKETPLSREHKTINVHDFEEDDNGVVRISWDHYEGIRFASYLLYKNTSTGLHLWHKIPANVNRFQGHVLPGENIYGYYIAIDLFDSIKPENPLKAESGPFTLAMSNIAEAEIELSVESAFSQESSINIFPTVSNDFVFVEMKKSTTGKIILRNILGESVLETETSTGFAAISVSDLPQGVYLVEVISGNEMIVSRIVVR